MQEINLKPQVPSFKVPSDKSKIDVRYIVISPYTSAHVFFDAASKEIKYKIEEPVLKDHEKELLLKFEERLYDLVNREMLTKKNVYDIIAYVDKEARLLLEGYDIKLNEESQRKILYYLYRDLVGLNEIEPLLRDPFVEEVKFNGVNTPVLIFHKVFGEMKTDLVYENRNLAASFVSKLAKMSGNDVSYTSPVFEGILPDGSHVNASYQTEISNKGSTFIIRKTSEKVLTPIQLISGHVLSPEMVAYLWTLMHYKSNILITGKKDADKSMIMNSLEFFIPPQTNSIDIRENAKDLMHVGEVVDAANLIKESVKHKIDYVIIKNIQGKEVLTLFQSMLPEHGSVSSIEGKNVDKVIKSLMSSPIKLSPKFVNNLDAVFLMGKDVVHKKEVDRMINVTEIVNVEEKRPKEENVAFKWDSVTDKFYHKNYFKAFDRISERHGVKKEDLMREYGIRLKIILEMYKRGLSDISSVQRKINDYYKDPGMIIAEFDIVVEK